MRECTKVVAERAVIGPFSYTSDEASSIQCGSARKRPPSHVGSVSTASIMMLPFDIVRQPLAFTHTATSGRSV